MNPIRYTVSAGFSLTFRREHNQHHYSPSVCSFSRYVDTLKRLAWTERRCGYGISIRERS